MTEWRPIETAPRNKKVDLGQAYGKGKFVRVPDCYWHRKAKQWITKHHDRAGYSALRLPFEPTHWMPIPSPPATLSAQPEDQR